MQVTAGKSISLRLIVGAALWILVAMLVMGVALTGIFRDHLERAFDASLRIQLQELLALSKADKKGGLGLKRHPMDPRFKKPFSGWYWELSVETNYAARSRSLWDQGIALPDTLSFDRETSFFAKGPRGEQLRAMGRSFTLPDLDKPFTILVAGPAKEVEDAVYSFANTMALSLAVLGFGLIVAALLQVRIGLSPLQNMRAMLSEIRGGRKSRMDGTFAAEIAPLVNELNALLDINQATVERARTQAGNLAHALKTPLAVLTNEADRLDDTTGDIFRTQATLMSDQITHHLSRARMAATRGVLGAHTDVHKAASSLSGVLTRVYEDDNIKISLEGTEDLEFRGEQQDLEEMLGNLMDNACKWANNQVKVLAEKNKESGRLYIDVEDDGPGIPENSRAEALRRGKRLDEATPGTGLGLSIVSDIAEMYEGNIKLGASAMGGLSVRLTLPST